MREREREREGRREQAKDTRITLKDSRRFLEPEQFREEEIQMEFKYSKFL